MQTANAFQYLYLSLGQRAIKAWQEGVSYQQKVSSLSLLAFQCLYLSLGHWAIRAWQEGVSFERKVPS